MYSESEPTKQMIMVKLLGDVGDFPSTCLRLRRQVTRVLSGCRIQSC